MTVTTTNRKNTFTTNGVTVDFAFTFNITDVTQVTAITVDAAGVETPYTNFTVVPNIATAGGELTTPDVLDNVDLVIIRDTQQTQEVDYIEGGRFPADSHEDALDKLTQQSQELQEQLDRTITANISDQNPLDYNGIIEKIEQGDIDAVDSANNYTDQQVFDSGAVTPSSVYKGDEQITQLVFWPKPANVSALIGDIVIAGTTALRDAVADKIYTTDVTVSGEITALDFGLLTATIGGVGVTLKLYEYYVKDEVYNKAETYNQSEVYTKAEADDEFSKAATNRWIDDQNFNVPGKDGYPLLDGTPQTITAGDEIAAGIVALTDCEQMTKVNGIIKSGNGVGIIQRSYPKDDAGEITKESQYGGFKNHLGAQIQADVDAFSAGGARITDDATTVYGAIDLSIATDGLQFLFLANEPGIIESVSDEVSERELRGGFLLVENSDGVAHIHGDGSIEQWGRVANTGAITTANFPIPFPTECTSAVSVYESPTTGDGSFRHLYAFTLSQIQFNTFNAAGFSNFHAKGK